MALTHGTITDTDPHFIIDPVTRTIRTASNKITLVQGDHNSERFTFEVPQEVEGHPMERSSKVQIHFINIDQMTKAQSAGVYEADDVEIIPATDTEPARVSFSWLISYAATKYQGVLNFMVRFVCREGVNILYAWNTTIHTGIQVSSGIESGETITDDYIDILQQWTRELKANQVTSLTQTQTSTEDDGENVWTATFGDGRTSELKVKNGSRGPTGLVGSIETVDGQPMKFFHGTRAEYDALTPDQKYNLFACITDEAAPELEEVRADLTGLKDGTVPAEKANVALALQDEYHHSALVKVELEAVSGEYYPRAIYVKLNFTDSTATHDAAFFKKLAFGYLSGGSGAAFTFTHEAIAEWGMQTQGTNTWDFKGWRQVITYATRKANQTAYELSAKVLGLSATSDWQESNYHKIVMDTFEVITYSVNKVK